MSDEAHVSDVEALDRFRSRLVLFLERAGQVLDEVGEEVKRTRIWLQSERRLELQREMKRAHRQLEMLEQEMFTARLSGLQNAKTGQQMKINRMRRVVRDLEDRQRAVQQWLRNFDSTVGVKAARVEKLRHFFDSEMVRGLEGLAESIRALDAYLSTPRNRPEEKGGSET